MDSTPTIQRLLTSADVAGIGPETCQVLFAYREARGDTGSYGGSAVKVKVRKSGPYNESMDFAKLLNPPQAAAFLGMSLEDFNRKCRRDGGPECLRFSRATRRFTEEALEQWRDPIPFLVAELLATEYRKGWVYFLQGEGGGNIKIGFASTLRDRVADIRACSPVWLTFLGAFPGSMAEEARLHQYFADVRLHGEWFAPHPELMRVIGEATGRFKGAMEAQ